MSAGLAFSPAVSALAGATMHPYAAALVDALRGQDGVVLDFARGHALQRSGGSGWLRPIGEATDFARASAGGRLPAAGPYEMVGSGVPRIDHDPVTREARGMLIEASAGHLSTQTVNIPAWGGASGSNINRPSMFAGGVAVEHFGPSSGYRWQYYTLAANTNCRVDAILERGVGTDAPPHFMMGFFRSAWVSAAYYIWSADRIDPGPGPLASSGYIVEQLGTGPNGGKMVRVSFILQSGDGGSTGFFLYPTATYGSSAGQSCIVHYACCTPGTLYHSPSIIGASAQSRASDNPSMPLPVVPADGFTVAFQARMHRVSNSTDTNVLFAFLPPSGTAGTVNISSYLGVGTVCMGFPGGVGVYRLAQGIAPGAECYGAIAWSAARGWRGTALGGAVVNITAQPGPTAELARMTIGSRAGAAPWGSTIKRMGIWPHGDFSDDAMRGLLAA